MSMEEKDLKEYNIYAGLDGGLEELLIILLF